MYDLVLNKFARAASDDQLQARRALARRMALISDYYGQVYRGLKKQEVPTVAKPVGFGLLAGTGAGLGIYGAARLLRKTKPRLATALALPALAGGITGAMLGLYRLGQLRTLEDYARYRALRARALAARLYGG